jgi:hypothetical protein
LLLCVALLTCNACATSSWNASDELPKPIDCDAAALEACEPPEHDPAEATLGASEEVDVVNRARWERCAIRHGAALRCFGALRKGGVLQKR